MEVTTEQAKSESFIGITYVAWDANGDPTAYIDEEGVLHEGTVSDAIGASELSVTDPEEHMSVSESIAASYPNYTALNEHTIGKPEYKPERVYVRCRDIHGNIALTWIKKEDKPVPARRGRRIGHKRLALMKANILQLERAMIKCHENLSL